MNDIDIVREILRRALQQRQLPCGGWSFHPSGVQASLEPTTLALLALRPDPGVTSRDAREFLSRTQNPNGSWPAFVGDDEEGAWVTSLVVLALQDSASHITARLRAARWLLASAGRESHWLWKWKFRTVDRHVAFDPDKFGWPWMPETNSWAVPTAFALLALRNTSCECSDSNLVFRVDRGTRMLLDRACPGGGWNAGNGWVYGVAMAPHPDATAIVLLSLVGEKQSPIVLKTLEWLERKTPTLCSPWSLAWAIMALAAFQRPTEEHIEHLVGLTDLGLTDGTATVAAALLALTTQSRSNPLLLTP